MKGFLALCKCLAPAAFGVGEFHFEDFGCLPKGVKHVRRIVKKVFGTRLGGERRTTLAMRAAQASLGHGAADRKVSLGKIGAGLLQ